MSDRTILSRRRLLKLFGASGISGLAGCGGQTGTPRKTANALDLSWSKLPGPPAGPVSCISVSKSQPDWIYAGSVTAGTHVSSDGGESWIQGRSGMHHRQLVWVSPHEPEFAYTNREVTRSGGQSWWDHDDHSPKTRYVIPNHLTIEDIEFDPFTDQYIYTATGQGLFRTENGGLDWEQISVPVNSGVTDYRRVAANPGTEGILILGTRSSGIAKTTDRGETWYQVPGSDDIPDSITRGLVFGDPETEEIYLTKNGFGLYRLFDGALSEITEDLPPLSFPWWAFLTASSDRRYLYFIAGSRATESPWDNRKLYEYDTDSGELHHVETPEKPSAVETHPSDPSTVYFGGTSWLYESQDRGNTWVVRSNGFVDNYLSTVAVNTTRPETVFPGSMCSTGLSVSRDRGQSYEWKRSGIGPWHEGPFGEHYIMQISAIDDYAYATTAAGLLISKDNGASWRMLNNEFSGQGTIKGTPFAHLHGLGVNPKDPQEIYVGTGRGGPDNAEQDIFEGAKMWKSKDGGESWLEITDGLPTSTETEIHDIVIHPEQPNIIYAGTIEIDLNTPPNDSGVGVGIYKSKNAGQEWRHLETPFSNIHSLTIDAGDPEIVYASVPQLDGQQNQGIFRTMDGGQAWEKILPHRTRALLALPSNPGLVFAGSQKYDNYWDVLVTNDRGRTWAEGDFTIQVGTELNERLYDAIERHPNVWGRGQILAFAYDESDSRLYMATNGAGLWHTETSNLVD